MSLGKLNRRLTADLDELKSSGRAKGAEMVVTGVKPAEGANGPRYFIDGYGDKVVPGGSYNLARGDQPRGKSPLMARHKDQSVDIRGVGRGTSHPHVVLIRNRAIQDDVHLFSDLSFVVLKCDSLLDFHKTIPALDSRFRGQVARQLGSGRIELARIREDA